MANPIGALGRVLFRNVGKDVADALGRKIGALPDARNEAEYMARRILELRNAGRADEVTEEMMSAADDPYMYANTPIDMSQEARMARAEDRIPVYHRTSSDFDAFDLSKSQSGQAVFVGPNAQNLQQAHNRKATGDSIMPLLLKTDNPLELDEFNLQEIKDRYAGGGSEFPFAFSDKTAEKLKNADFDAIISKDIYGDSLPNFGVDEIAVLKPENLRSQFARFDPEFSHLRNLSASILSTIGFSGLAAALREKEEGM